MNNRPNYLEVINDLDLFLKLKQFDPVLIGTPPLGIEIDTSDIDIACCSENLEEFKQKTRIEFGHFRKFETFDTVVQANQTTIVRFAAAGWPIELFCQTLPTTKQWGVRHFKIEQRLLQLFPWLRKNVKHLKQEGLSTEEAFASLLGLDGDPYSSMLKIEGLSDKEFGNMISQQDLSNFEMD